MLHAKSTPHRHIDFRLLRRGCCSVILALIAIVAMPQTRFGEEPPSIACIVPANAGDTGKIFQMRKFADGGVLIASESGFFFAREVNGQITVPPVSVSIGRSLTMHELQRDRLLIAV